MPLNVSCVQRWQSLDGFTSEKANALPMGLVKVPTLHRVAVGRNLDSWWRYKGRPMLLSWEISWAMSVPQSAALAATREGRVWVGADVPTAREETVCFIWVVQQSKIVGCCPGVQALTVQGCYVATPVDMLAIEVANVETGVWERRDGRWSESRTWRFLDIDDLVTCDVHAQPLLFTAGISLTLFWEGHSGEEISTRWLCLKEINHERDSWLVWRSLQAGFSCLQRHRG